MNLVYGEVVDIRIQDGMQVGTVRVSGALKKVPLELVQGAQSGDAILMCDGVAIGKVERTASADASDQRGDSSGFRHLNHVSGDSR